MDLLGKRMIFKLGNRKNQKVDFVTFEQGNNPGKFFSDQKNIFTKTNTKNEIKSKHLCKNKR